MKNIAKALVLGTAAFIATGANAAVIKYAFQAHVSTVSEYDHQTGIITNVDHSDFAGTLVANGDLIEGFFQYDTSAALSSYQPPQQPGAVWRNYDAGATNFISYVDASTSLRFDSMPTMNWLGQVSVNDSIAVPGAYTADYFFEGVAADSPLMFSNAQMWFDDLTGTAFSDAAIPSHLDFNAFQFASLNSGFVRHSDGNQMFFSADLTSMKQVDVPEPSGSFLFIVAGAGLLAARRARSRG